MLGRAQPTAVKTICDTEAICVHGWGEEEAVVASGKSQMNLIWCMHLVIEPRVTGNTESLIALICLFSCFSESKEPPFWQYLKKNSLQNKLCILHFEKEILKK